MANEVTKVELYGQNNDGDPRRYEVASGVAIAKGTILELTDARTAVAATASTALWAGVAAMGKAADDKSTSISAWTNGIFEMAASLAIVVGQKVKSNGTSNFITGLSQPNAQSSFAIGFGVALQSAEPAERINVRINL